MTIAEIADLVQMSDHHNYGPVLIGIDGIGGAGKTEFAKRLQAFLPSALVISMDSFIDKTKLHATSWDTGAFDRARLEREVLKPLTHERSASYEKLDWDSEQLSAPQPVPPSLYVIVEGQTAIHPDIAHYYDYRVWINTPPEVAMQRGMARDSQAGNDNDHMWPVWARNDQDYIKRHHPDDGVDFVFDNDGDALAPGVGN